MVSALLLLSLSLGDGDLIEDFEGAGSDAWERVVSDTHPPYNIIERIHDPGQAKSGSQYLHLRTMGGSTAVRRSGRRPWPVDADRPYEASVWVRLSGTRRNSASLSLTWLNASGEVLAEQWSAPLLHTDGWARLELEVPRSPSGAAGLLPALHFEGPDVRGLCDFDRLEVAAVERLDLRPAGRPMAVYTTEDYPRFTLTPAGLPAGLHAVTVTMTSLEGKAVQRTGTIDLPSARTVSVDFPPALPGMHQVRASVDGTRAWKSLEILVTPPGLLPAESPVYDRSSMPLPEPPEAALHRRILNPRNPVVLDPRFFTEDGQPTRAYFTLRIIDQVLSGAEPIPLSGLFPSTVRTAAFRKGASVLFAVWSESGTVDLAIPFSEGRLLVPALAAPRDFRPGEIVPVGATPVFILDVDPPATDLGFEVSSDRIAFQLNPSRLLLRLTNRSRADALRDVTITIDDLPAGWRASSRRIRIAELGPSAVHEEPLDLIVPATESERGVVLKFAAAFLAQGKERTILASRTLTLASPIRIESAMSPEKILNVRILNASDHPMTVSIRSRVPGLPERLDLMRDLPSGSRSKPLEFAVREAGSAEIFVQESGGDRALARRSVPLR